MNKDGASVFEMQLVSYCKSSYVDATVTLKISKAGDIRSGRLNMGENKITDIYYPKSFQYAATKI